MGRHAAFLLTLLAATAIAQPKKDAKEAPPHVIVALPLAVEMGKTTKVTLRGLGLDTVTEIRFQEPRSTGKLGKSKKVAVPNEANPKRIGDSEIEVEVTLPPEVPGGVVPFTLASPTGESKPHRLIVRDDTAPIVEKEPNDGFKNAQPIQIPCVVDGSIRQAQDVDVFRVDGKRDETLVFEVQANRFGSPLDAMLTIYDDAGRVVAVADDSDGSTDPILSVKLPKDGTYYAALLDANDQGGSIYVYRLVCRRQD